MIRFYAPDIEQTLTLPESDSGHAVRVLRMRPGDELEVTDGRGKLYACRITDAHQRHVAVEILRCQNSPLCWPQEITMAVAPTKHLDRMEWMIEKLTEIGVNRIVPVLCNRSERREIKTERLEKIAVSAMKQSLKCTLPVIDAMTPLRQFLASCSAEQKFIAHCDSTSERKLLAREYRPRTSAAVLIGPEGDFDPAEVDGALKGGWMPVTLGDNRLRTETAAIVACDTFHIIDQINPE